MKKNAPWLTGIGILLVLCLGLWAWFATRPGQIAEIYVDGTRIQSIDLSKVTQAYSFPVETQWGYNIIQVEPGRICVMDSDCPDRVCIHTGWLKGIPIVCLPHRLVIQMTDADALDSITS